MPEFIDTHAHLSMLEHATEEEILNRAKEAGITKMVTVSTDATNWRPCSQMAEKLEHIYFSLGVHPHEAIHWAKWAPELLKWFENDEIPEKCVAIGEMGLDYHYNYSPPDIQVRVCEEHLELAKKLELPVILHCRDAFDDLYRSISKVGLSSKGGVMHCFTGNPEQAKAALDLGLTISFSGILTFKKAEILRDAAKAVPLDKMVLETDCPFLAPQPNRGKPNEPSFLPFTANTLALVKGVPIEEIAARTTENAIKLFNL